MDIGFGKVPNGKTVNDSFDDNFISEVKIIVSLDNMCWLVGELKSVNP